jgi:hypothetical protein
MKTNTYILTYYEDTNPLILQTTLDVKTIEGIIDTRPDLQDDENYELYGHADSEIILHECKKLDYTANYLDAPTLEY